MLLQQIINGITIGSTYALVAIGFSMVFGVIELTNFSNSSLYMLGAYISLLLFTATSNNFFLSFLISICITGFAGYCIDAFALKKLRKNNAPKISGLITTLGMSMIIDNMIIVTLGSDTKAFQNYFDFGKLYIGNAIISWTQIIILVTAFALMGILSIVVYKTKLGKAMRAIAQSQDVARLMGVDCNKIISLTFIISGCLACISGTFVGMYYQNIDTTMGSIIGLKTFASAVLGGVGVLPGAVVGGLCLGLIESLVAAYVSMGYRDAIAFTILIVVLLLKPNGLFGTKTVEKV